MTPETMHSVLQLAHTDLVSEPPIFALARVCANSRRDVLCLGYWTPGQRNLSRPARQFTILRLNRGRWSGLPRFLRGLLRLSAYYAGVLSLGRRLRSRVVICYSHELLPLGLILKYWYRAKLVYYCTEYNQLTTKDFSTGWAIPKLLEAPLVRCTDYVVSVELNRARLQSSRWKRSIDAVILNTPPLGTRTERQPANARTPCTIGVAYTGSLGSVNMVGPLIRSVAAVPDVSLSLYGRLVQGQEREFFAAMDSLPVEARARIGYFGRVPYAAVANVLRGFDIGAVLYDKSTTNVEFAAPAKLFEYLKAGLGVVCTDQPQARRIVERYDCGWVVSADAAERQLRTLWETLLSDRDEVRRRRANAARAFDDCLHYEKQAEPLIEYIALHAGTTIH